MDLFEWADVAVANSTPQDLPRSAESWLWWEDLPPAVDHATALLLQVRRDLRALREAESADLRTFFEDRIAAYRAEHARLRA
jgi:hypothetical protein